MNHHRPLPDDVLQLLVFLLDLIARDAGYEVRGATGWATAAQIQKRTRVWSTHELMRAQAKLGRVLGHDARVPGQARARWIYRLTRKGADAVARALGAPAATVAPPPHPEETRVLLDASARHAIEALRAALTAKTTRTRDWVPGEDGWRSALELTAEMDLAREAAGALGRSFTAEDVRGLAKLGLAECRVVGRTNVYRLQPAGAALRTLEWREPD